LSAGFFTAFPGNRRGSIGRWLSRALFKDWSLKLLALAVTLALWFVVAEQPSERELLVEPRIEGHPAAMYEVGEVSATPSKVRARGPSANIKTLQTAPTTAISIQGRSASFDAPQTSISIPDPKVNVTDTVNVHVTIVPIGNPKPKSRETN